MPYKTRFRDISFPLAQEEREATDANTLRSIGAAFYRQGMQDSHGSLSQKARGKFTVLKNMVKRLDDPYFKKQITYYIQGGLMAAKRKKDEKNKEYFLGLLEEID